MITGISIENFKGIGERARIELRPITLLFGPNSAGKSTLLHAIHYAREVLEGRNPDADRTVAGGPHLDLGGFESFVHKHELGRRVLFRFDMDLSQVSLPDYRLGREDRARAGLPLGPEPQGPGAVVSAQPPDAIDYSTEVRDGWVEFSVAWSEFRGACFVASYGVGLNGIPLATIECDHNRRQSWISDLNTKHPLFRPGFASGEYCGSEDDSVADYWIRESHGEEDLRRQPIYLEGQTDALPRWRQVLGLLLKRVELMTPEDVEEAPEEGRSVAFEASMLTTSLTQLLVGPGEILREELTRFRYLGPLRATPSRMHSPPRFPQPSRWSEGLAAWDALHSDDFEFVNTVSDWLVRPDRLDAGYILHARAHREVDVFGPFMSELLAEGRKVDVELLKSELELIPVRWRLLLIDRTNRVELLPHDVGVGIAQLIPVVVLVLDPHTGFAGIEQPELHVHPRIQVGLGDLLIWGITDKPSAQFLVETHSEHLLLRLLRRIRETHEGDLAPGTYPSLTPEQVSVVYVENAGGTSRFIPLRIDRAGEFIDRWPRGFFEERAQELF